MHEWITGIQQVGIGVQDAEAAKYLYKDLFGMDVLVFEDRAEASLMTQYTGNEVRSRHAILTMNLAGGGGFEIWQYTCRTPQPQSKPALGDLGIFAIKMKTPDVQAAHQYYKSTNPDTTSAIAYTADGDPHFCVTDQQNNLFEIVKGEDWFAAGNKINGGVAGAVIGVSDLERSVNFYQQLLGIDQVVVERNISCDLAGAPTGRRFNRAILQKKVARKGAFCKLLGSVHIELVQALDYTPVKIYHNRFWGDCGFIHLCFDVLNMDRLKQELESSGYPFTVDSAGSFSMGTSAGRFCYVEDPDGTLIELVETHTIPIVKKWKWHLDLTRRKQEGPLPNWMIRMLGLSKVR